MATNKKPDGTDKTDRRRIANDWWSATPIKLQAKYKQVSDAKNIMKRETYDPNKHGDMNSFNKVTRT